MINKEFVLNHFYEDRKILVMAGKGSPLAEVEKSAIDIFLDWLDDHSYGIYSKLTSSTMSGRKDTVMQKVE